MAEKKVTIAYETDYDGKAAKTAQADLKKTAEEAKKTGKTTEQAGGQGQKGFENMALGIGKAVAAFAAIKGAIDFFASSITAANENARAVNTLAAAYQAVGYTANGAMKQAQDFASKMQQLTGIADEAFLNAQRLLANYGVVGTKAQEAIQAAYALSIGRSIDFASAMDIVSKAAAGQTQTLARYGIQIDKNTAEGEKFDAVLAQINERFGATAQAAMGDSTTKLNALKESWGDFKEQVGAGLNEGLVPAVDFLTQAVGVLNKTFKGLSAGWAVSFDWLFTAIQGVKAAFLTLGEYAIKSFQPVISLMSHIPIIGDNIKGVFDSANNALSELAANSREQTVEMWKMATPVSAIWETEKAITEETTAQLKANEDLVNSKRDLVQATNEVAEAEKAANEARAESNETQAEKEKQQAEELYGLKKVLGIQEQKDKKSAIESVTGMLKQGSKEQMAVQKAQGMAQAAIATYQAANSAYAALAPIPIVGPALGAAAAAAAIAYGLNNVAQISGIKLAEGGLVKAVTGGVPAVIGEGGSDEAVLPLNNSKALQRIGGAIAEEGGNMGAPVQIYIQTQAVGGVEAILEQLTDASRNGVVQALEFANLNYKVGAEQQGFSV